MKPSFHARLINGPFDDPGLFVRVLREGRAFLFDLGWTGTLTARDILKTSPIFVSHMHMDHFIGFDAILRVNLRRDTPLFLFGPEGFIDCVAGKLRGYTWNLSAEYPLVMNVSEVSGNTMMHTVFRAATGFRKEETGQSPFRGTVWSSPPYSVSAITLDHQIPCMAFCLEEDVHININKAGLNERDLPVGPWLGELKQVIREKKPDHVFAVEGRSIALDEVRDIATLSRGQKISYVADVLGSTDNITGIVDLAKGSDILFIEAYFLDRDRARARQRCHLTAREAGMIARMAAVKKLELMHFSPRYTHAPELIRDEAMSEFQREGTFSDILR